MRIRIVYEHDATLETVVTMKCVPRIGEKICLEEDEVVRVTYVIFTPWDGEQQAIVTVKKAKP